MTINKLVTFTVPKKLYSEALSEQLKNRWKQISWLELEHNSNTKNFVLEQRYHVDRQRSVFE